MDCKSKGLLLAIAMYTIGVINGMAIATDRNVAAQIEQKEG